MIYIDTSVLVPYYAPESASEQADTIIRSEPQPIVGDLTDADPHARRTASCVG